jgi:hypothetical protein
MTKVSKLKTALNEDPRSNEIEQSYWLRAINWTHLLWMRVQDKKSHKLRLNLHGIILEGKTIGSNQKKIKNLNTRAHYLKNQDPS